jgi:hypothetical protein
MPTDEFREMFEAMKETADGLIQANTGIKRMADAALKASAARDHARVEHDDLRETVARLETLVMELVHEVQLLRGGSNGTGKA